jgi:L-lysine 6-transaminase
MHATHLAEFVATFARCSAIRRCQPCSSWRGTLAVENALKTAFDWKSRRNEAAGRSRNLGTKVLHLKARSMAGPVTRCR